MFFWNATPEILAVGGVVRIVANGSWQRGVDDASRGVNSPIFLVNGQTANFVPTGDVTVDYVQRVIGFDGRVGAARRLDGGVFSREGADPAEWDFFNAFGMLGNDYTLLATERSGGGVVMQAQQAADATAPLSAPVPVFASTPGATVVSSDGAGRGGYIAPFFGELGAGGAVVLSYQAFGPTFDQALGPRQTVATLADRDVAWTASDWNDTRVVLLSETPGGVRLQTFRNDGVPSDFNRDYVIAIDTQDIQSISYDFYNEVPGGDVLLVTVDRAPGVAADAWLIRLTIGDDFNNGFSQLQSFGIAVTGAEPSLRWLKVYDTPDTAREGDILLYYTDGGAAKARLYDPDTNSVTAELVIATGLSDGAIGDLGDIIDFNDGRYGFSWTETAADGLTSELRMRVVDLRDAAVVAFGDATAERFAGTVFSDYWRGGEGADSVVGNFGDDTLLGDGGDDWLRGDAGRDYLHGFAGNDTVEGGDSADVVIGGDGDDVLTGGAENDYLGGEADNDRLSGGAGADTLDGGGGRDTADYNASAAGVQVDIGFDNALGGDAQGDRFISIEDVTATNAADGVWGSDDANAVFLWRGDDFADGRGGADMLDGGEGSDTLNGGEGGDALFGGADLDALGGDGGNDALDGGLGNDWLWGGAGSDAFVIATGSLQAGDVDRIMDMQENQPTGNDWLRFDGVRYDQLVWYEQGSSAVVQVVLDGGGSAYVEIANFTLGQLDDQYYFV